MGNSSGYQRKFRYSKLIKLQHGEYCRGCGISPTSKGFTKKFTKLYVDKINNDGNHNIKDTKLTDFQLLCPACNKSKDPHKSFRKIKSKSAAMTPSEKTNQRAEYPWRDWIEKEVHTAEQNGQGFQVEDAINGGAELFKISVERIERNYLPKITSINGRFLIKNDMIYSKKFWSKY